MATYVLGDIQGCFDELLRLLDEINFDSGSDRLLFAGDLVNRGPKSLETLRFVRGLGDAADSVLGNHDLHLLALYHGNDSHASGNSLDSILQAEDRDELLAWLQQRPLLMEHAETGSWVLHAGLPPQWTPDQAKSLAREAEAMLRSDKAGEFFQQMYGNKPKRWKDDLQGMDRLRFIINCFTRLRYCSMDGRLSLKDKGAPGTQRDNTYPWFEIQTRQTRGQRICIGHWSTLGLLHREQVWALDTGCLWGGKLTALRLEDEKVFQVPCKAVLKPKPLKTD